MTALLANINRYRQPLVAVVLYRFHFPPPHGDILPKTIRNIGFTGAGAPFSRLVQDILRDLLKH